MADGVVDALRAARVILERGWCQGAEARDAGGQPTHPASPRARSWSVTGAIYAGTRFDGSPERRDVFETAVAMLGEVLLAAPGRWNDAPGRTQAHALEALDELLRLVEGASASPAPDEEPAAHPPS